MQQWWKWLHYSSICIAVMFTHAGLRKIFRHRTNTWHQDLQHPLELTLVPETSWLVSVSKHLRSIAVRSSDERCW